MNNMNLEERERLFKEQVDQWRITLEVCAAQANEFYEIMFNDKIDWKKQYDDLAAKYAARFQSDNESSAFQTRRHRDGNI